MPAALPAPSSKHDIRLYDSDVTLLAPLLANRNSTLNEFVRDLVHRAANSKRRELGLPQEPPL